MFNPTDLDQSEVSEAHVMPFRPVAPSTEPNGREYSGAEARPRSVLSIDMREMGTRECVCGETVLACRMRCWPHSTTPRPLRCQFEGGALLTPRWRLLATRHADAALVLLRRDVRSESGEDECWCCGEGEEWGRSKIGHVIHGAK